MKSNLPSRPSGVVAGAHELYFRSRVELVDEFRHYLREVWSQKIEARHREIANQGVARLSNGGLWMLNTVRNE
jgi:hypothetical protein